jgi:hypothetical protein
VREVCSVVGARGGRSALRPALAPARDRAAVSWRGGVLRALRRRVCWQVVQRHVL